MEKQILVRIPGYSTAEIAEMLGGYCYNNEGITIATRSNKVDSAMEPATVAVLISSGAIILSQVLQSITAVYLDRKKSQEPTNDNPSVEVNVSLTFGGKHSITVKNSEEIENLLVDLPSDPSELALIEMK